MDGARERVLAALAKWLEVWEQEGFAPIRTAWLARAHPFGTPVSVQLTERELNGTFAGIAEDGTLLLDTAEGRRRVVAGLRVLRGAEVEDRALAGHPVGLQFLAHRERLLEDGEHAAP